MYKRQVPTLLLFNQPFGINALVGLIALSGILMRNTLILIGQIHHCLLYTSDGQFADADAHRYHQRQHDHGQ